MEKLKKLEELCGERKYMIPALTRSYITDDRDEDFDWIYHCDISNWSLKEDYLKKAGFEIPADSDDYVFDNVVEHATDEDCIGNVFIDLPAEDVLVPYNIPAGVGTSCPRPIPLLEVCLNILAIYRIVDSPTLSFELKNPCGGVSDE